MSFCQKHRNHHCHHAHSCSHPQHKTAKQSQQNHKKQKKEASHHQEQHGCTFQGGYNFHNNQEVAFSVELQKDMEKVVLEMRKELETVKGKWEKSQHENRHLHAQIQYYREQFSTIIDNNTTDGRLQIKKRLKQTTELTLRLKSLQAENIRLSNENQNLKRSIHDDKALRQQNKNVNCQLEDKYSAVHHQLKSLAKEKEELKSEIEDNRKKNLRMEQKYELLRKEFNFECENYRKQRQNLSRQLQTCKKELARLKGSSNKEKQLAELDRQSTEKRQQMYKQKISQYESKTNQLQTTIKEITQKCEELQEDLKHAKILLQKNTANSEQYQKIEKQLEQHAVESRTVVREKFVSPISNKQNSSAFKDISAIRGSEEDKLRQQIQSLRLQIVELQGRNSAHFEEVIMTIGASEAFRKLVEEKNAVIKRLMREKGEIYAKAFNSGL